VAEQELAAGRVVVVFPEGSRSRAGEVGEFHSGAFRAARAAGVAVVPVGLAGTRRLLPVHGRLRLSPVTVRIGCPLEPTVSCADARAAVAALAAQPATAPVSRAYQWAAAVALSVAGPWLAFGWGVAEAISVQGVRRSGW
jgi:hypothetical protein